jgi:Flp pilus assembly protein TadG
LELDTGVKMLRFKLQTRRQHRSRGAVLIEAAIVMFILMLLTFGMVEFGYLIYVMHMTTGAARSGVRNAIVAGASTSSIQTAVDNVMTSAGFLTSQYTVQVDDKTSGTTNTTITSIVSGHDVAVHVKATWSNIGVSTIQLVSPTRVIDSVVVMRKEG